jgi:hypothetical protein
MNRAATLILAALALASSLSEAKPPPGESPDHRHAAGSLSGDRFV